VQTHTNVSEEKYITFHPRRITFSMNPNLMYEEHTN